MRPMKFGMASCGNDAHGPRETTALVADVAHEINDVSFIGVVHPEHGPGFDVYVGGGLSTNPMLAQIPHVLLAAHAGTLWGVESNAMQFYPEASLPEAEVHPGLYVRRNGHVDFASVTGPGFGYRISSIRRTLPEPAARA